MPTPSIARDFFDKLVSATDPIAAIKGLVNKADPVFEGDWLDFKLQNPDPTQRDKQLREMWPKALSGFANNQGGVLVWGIDARKVQKGSAKIDAAVKVTPVSDPLGLKSRLIELQRNAVDPPLGNVLLEAFPLSPGSRKGFVICCIPEGAFKPYRAELGDKQYYVRMGDSFHVLSRAMLQSLFYPKLLAVFSVTAKVSYQLIQPPGLDAWLKIHVQLGNHGTRTAKESHIRLKSKFIYTSRQSWPPPNWFPNQDELVHRDPIKNLHPELDIDIYYTTCKVPTISGIQTGNEARPQCDPLDLHFRIFTEDQPAQDIVIAFSSDEIRNLPFPEGTTKSAKADMEGNVK